jgi:type I restriction enzyme S subunit
MHHFLGIFTNSWEQRKLGEFGSVSMCRRIFKNQTKSKGEVPFYKIGTFGSKPDAFISAELFQQCKRKYPYPHVGDILISAAGTIGRTVEFRGEMAYFQDSNIVWLEHGDDLDNRFLKHFYETVDWPNLEGSTITRLYNKNLLETKIAVPRIQEQAKIGDFFDFFDDAIILHQRKLEELKNLKKSLLQKMFI